VKFRTSEHALLRFETAAMTDIVFLLLIFFLLTSSFIVNTGIRVDLPAAASTEPQTDAGIVLSVTKDGDLFLNERKVAWSNAEDELRRALAGSDEKLVVVRADKELALGRAVEVMDMARRSGARRLAIAADYVRTGNTTEER